MNKRKGNRNSEHSSSIKRWSAGTAWKEVNRFNANLWIKCVNLPIIFFTWNSIKIFVEMKYRSRWRSHRVINVNISIFFSFKILELKLCFFCVWIKLRFISQNRWETFGLLIERTDSYAPRNGMQRKRTTKNKNKKNKKLICCGYCCCCCCDQNCYFSALFGTLTKRYFFVGWKWNIYFYFIWLSCLRATMSVDSFSLTIVSHIPLIKYSI